MPALLGTHHIFHVSGLRVKLDLKVVRCEGVYWIDMAQDYWPGVTQRVPGN